MENNNIYNTHVDMQTQNISYLSITFKTILGLIVVVLTALLINTLTEGTFLFVGFGGLFFSIITYVLIIYLNKLLIKGSSASVLIYLSICVLEGVLFVAAVNALSYLAVYAYDIDADLLTAALGLAALLTIAVVLGTLIVITVKGDKLLNSPTFTRIGNILGGAMLGLVIVLGVSFIFTLFGSQFFSGIYYEALIGSGPLGFLISAIFILFACYTLANTLLTAKKLKMEGASSHLEWTISALLVLSIINIYIEVFRLIIRILGSRN